MKIASYILSQVKKGIEFTDLQIKAGTPISYRSPVRYFKDESFVPSKEDIKQFAEFADKNYIQLLVKGQGQFNKAFNITEGNDGVKLRCNFFIEGLDNKISVSIRRIPLNIASMKDLGVPKKLKELILTNLQGLILITGPTGAGKTTTQFSIAEELNKEWPMHIVTLESPIEYELESKMSVITQREIPTNVDTFEMAIEAVRKQRPELIIIGEITNKETVDAMFRVAETGHLVIAGTHANSAEGAIDTLLTWFTGSELETKRRQLSNNLLGINSQRLLPSYDGNKAMLAYDLLIPNDSVRNNIARGEVHAIHNSLLTNRNESELYNEVLAEMVFNKKIKETTGEKACTNTDEFYGQLKRLESGIKRTIKS